MTRDFAGGSFAGVPGFTGCFPASAGGVGTSLETIRGGNREYLEFTSGVRLLCPNFCSGFVPNKSISIPLQWDKV